MSRQSSVGIDSLRAGRSGDRIPVAARFFAPVQTGSGVHEAPFTMGTGSFPGVKRPGRGVDHPTPSSADVKGRVELPLWAFVACSRVNFIFLLDLYEIILQSGRMLLTLVHTFMSKRNHVNHYCLNMTLCR
jgi:hypothetical protein